MKKIKDGDNMDKLRLTLEEFMDLVKKDYMKVRPTESDEEALEYFNGDEAQEYIKCSVVKRVDTFLNTIFRKDRITPGFPCRTPLFHLVYNHQAKSEGV